MSLSERFWSKVDVRGEDECWEWKASRNRNGYGSFLYKGSKINASRVAWILTNGEPEDGMVVMHKCNNKPCCNPNHLEMGTHRRNLIDAGRDGLLGNNTQKGSAHSQAKLTEKDVLDIRRRFEQGNETKTELAREYGVGQSTIHKIVTRQRWKHI